MSELGKLFSELSKDGSDRFLESLKEAANDPKWEEKREINKMAIEKIEKRQQQEKEERIQRKLDKLIKEEERKCGCTLRELFKGHYEEQIERLRRDAISSVQIDEEERIQRKIDEKIKEMQEGATLTLREIWGEEYEEEMERMRTSEMITVRIEIRQEERKLQLEEKIQEERELEEKRLEEKKREREEKRGEQLEEKKRQEEQLRKRGENPNIPLTVFDLLHICPGFDQETLQRACDDLNLEIAKRIARETYPNKFK